MTRLGLALPALLLVTASALAQVDLGTEEQRANGKRNYDKYCSQCHGDTGDGNGYATTRVKPLPRDFTTGKYKFRTTPNGKLPTDADIERVIRIGLPYTSMPGWPNFTDTEVRNLVYYLKSFSPDFENPDMYADPIEIGTPLESTEESIARGRQVYEEQGCAACHGENAKGNGLSAPTMADDAGDHLRPADMTQPWTFRGGATKKDMFRTFSTGLNGTPMPSYGDTLPVEDRWHLVNYMSSLAESPDPRYASLLVAAFTEDDIDLANSEELFAQAQLARFPLIGQIIEPGRNFFPSATSIEAKAIYNRRDIAVMVRWNDMKQEMGGQSGPELVVPPWNEDNDIGAGGGDEGGDDFFGGLEEEPSDDSFFGDAEADEGDDFFGDAEADEGDDFFGEAEDDFFGEAESGSSGPASEFSDAVALQFPTTLPTGNRKPYFIFGDSQSPVDLWFGDLDRQMVLQYTGRGSDALEMADADDFEISSSYDDGTWTVVFKRALRSGSNVTFGTGQFTPVAFSVWDGFNRERGNKRALSSWYYVYTEPIETASVTVPMARAAVIALLVEIVVIFWIRRRKKGGEAAEDLATSGAAAS